MAHQEKLQKAAIDHHKKVNPHVKDDKYYDKIEHNQTIEAFLAGGAKMLELLGESVGLIDALHECESDRILLKKELAAEREMSRKLAGALDFYSKPRFISRDKGKTWQELVQIIPNVFSEPMNPDIQREVMFGTVAKEAIAQYRAAREGKS